MKERDYTGQEFTTGSERINLRELKDANSIVVDIIDVFGYKYSKSGAGRGNTEDTPTLPSILDEAENNPNAEAPSITISNPSRSGISLYSGDMFNLRFHANVHTKRRTITVAIDGNPIQTATSGEIFVIPVPTTDLPLGNHTVTITATDANNQNSTKNFTLTILPR